MLEDVGLKKIPRGDWFCEKCAKKAANATTKRTSARGKK